METSVDHASFSEGSQESGWTMYFEYFLRRERGAKSSCSSQFGGNSTVSDAASAAPRKPLNRVEFSIPKSCKGLDFKRRKTNGILDEDPLEDTASSPVGSPKVSGLTDDINSCKKQENLAITQEDNSSCNSSPLRPQGRNKMLHFDGENEHTELRSQGRNMSHFDGENECTELKKRGLCLVPMSMAMNYIS